MDLKQFDEIFAHTLADGKVSRSERRALTALLEELGADEQHRALLRSRAFDAARSAVESSRLRELLAGLEDLVSLLSGGADASSRGNLADVRFSPGDACVERIAGLLGAARRSVDICVFTITDDRISRAVFETFRRGVQVRIVTDNEKAFDAGSDVETLRRAGVPVAVDTSPYHMHHKFAVFDGQILLTGSYNWTRGAASDNEENFIVTDDPRLVRPFAEEFEQLWGKFRRSGD